MAIGPPKRDAGGLARSLCATVALVLAALIVPAGAQATLSVVGSPLSQPASLNTAEDLNYKGTDTHVPASREAPKGVVHTYHYGADTALWNTALGGADAAMPADGQAVRIKLMGCAVAAPGGPAPLTEIHFQTLSPRGGGAVQVSLSSQPFNIPVCGQGGAGPGTVSSYDPINLCVHAGDYVAFNDEGGFVEHAYQSGVPYMVLAPASGSSFNSFIRGNGTRNGALFSPLDKSDMDGFAVNAGEELLMQVILGTGSDARYVCPGGSKDAPPVLSPLSIHPQTAGVGRRRLVAVTIFCRPRPGCQGTASLTVGTGHVAVGSAGFRLQGNYSTSLRIRVSRRLLAIVRSARRHHRRATTTVTATMGSTTVSQTIALKLN